MLKYKSTVSPMLQMFLNILSENSKIQNIWWYAIIYIYIKDLYIYAYIAHLPQKSTWKNNC